MTDAKMKKLMASERESKAKMLKVAKVIKGAIRTCHDEDCPRCGFPETIDVRNAKNMAIIFRECSVACGWMISGEDLLALNKK